MQINREVEIMVQSKSCPNVVHFNEEFTCDGERYIVMELADRGDLHQMLEGSGFDPLTEDQARSITE